MGKRDFPDILRQTLRFEWLSYYLFTVSDNFSHAISVAGSCSDRQFDVPVLSRPLDVLHSPEQMGCKQTHHSTYHVQDSKTHLLKSCLY
jgi:hypothetical protein